ncbi:mitochondrial ribosomal death-associated protein 3-domain-containing protein [Kalaharituber pfeilii]|nr:mitochondrial ribosomal death-associated protein 3-domain-containing protein [Kalaharituber pfeilii]
MATRMPKSTPRETLLPPSQHSGAITSSLSSSPLPPSSSPQAHGLVKKKTTVVAPPKKGGSTLKLKRKRVVQTSRPAEHGLRRAQRKNLVLSNNNAINVPLATFKAQTAVTTHDVGRVFSFEGQMVDTLKTLEGFQRKQGWEFFRTPSTLVREESIEIGRLIAWVNGEKVPLTPAAGREGVPIMENLVPTEEVEKKNEEGAERALMHDPHWVPVGGYLRPVRKPANVNVDPKGRWAALAEESRVGRRVIHGPRGIGKSILLLQAMAWAHQRNWVVITIPNAQDLVIGHTEYEHDLTSGLWLQRQYTASLLKRVLRANANVLKSVQLSQDHVYGRDASISRRESLFKLVEMGGIDPALSWDVFMDTEYKPIHAHDLALPATFISYLTGRRSFWRGLTLTATTGRSPATPALTFALNDEPPTPYAKIDPLIAPSISGAPVLNMSILSKPQTKALMEYYRDSGLYGENVDKTLAEKWVLSSGIPKELRSACLRVKY